MDTRNLSTNSSDLRTCNHSVKRLRDSRPLEVWRCSALASLTTVRNAQLRAAAGVATGGVPSSGTALFKGMAVRQPRNQLRHPRAHPRAYKQHPVAHLVFKYRSFTAQHVPYQYMTLTMSNDVQARWICPPSMGNLMSSWIQHCQNQSNGPGNVPAHRKRQ